MPRTAKLKGKGKRRKTSKKKRDEEAEAPRLPSNVNSLCREFIRSLHIQ